jgi:hypothetical protein
VKLVAKSVQIKPHGNAVAIEGASGLLFIMQAASKVDVEHVSVFTMHYFLSPVQVLREHMEVAR